MNPLLARLQPYPFERLRALMAGVVPSAAHKAISLGIGEPRHATPALIEVAFLAGLTGLSSYPATIGEPRQNVYCGPMRSSPALRNGRPRSMPGANTNFEKALSSCSQLLHKST